MQHIMQEKRATDAYAGPDHHYNDNVSYPSSGSLSPINCGQSHAMPSGHQADNHSSPEKLMECVNLNQRKRRYEWGKEGDGSNDDEDENEDDKEPTQKRKKSKRGFAEEEECVRWWG